MSTAEKLAIVEEMHDMMFTHESRALANEIVAMLNESAAKGDNAMALGAVVGAMVCVLTTSPSLEIALDGAKLANYFASAALTNHFEEKETVQ